MYFAGFGARNGPSLPSKIAHSKTPLRSAAQTLLAGVMKCTSRYKVKLPSRIVIVQFRLNKCRRNGLSSPPKYTYTRSVKSHMRGAAQTPIRGLMKCTTRYKVYLSSSIVFEQLCLKKGASFQLPNAVTVFCPTRSDGSS